MPITFIKASIFASSLWLIIIISRHTGLLIFDGMSVKSILAIILFLMIFFIATFFATVISGSAKYPVHAHYKASSVRGFSRFLILLQLFAICSLLAKHSNLISDGIFDLSAITEQRLNKGRGGDSIGASLIGMIGFALSGFFVLGFCYARFYYAELTSFTRIFLQINFLIGCFLQLLGGGRFGLVIFAFFILFFFLLSGFKFRRLFTFHRAAFFMLSIVLALIVFHSIFVHRFIGYDYSQVVALSVVEGRLVSAGPSDYLRELIISSDFSEFFFGISMYLYYIGHSLSQLDVLLTIPESPSWPLYLQYQLYPLFAVLNNLGFSFMDIQSILATLPVAGVYSTAIGGAYLDFGYVGMFPFFFLIGFVGSSISIKAVRTRRFNLLIFGSLYFVYFFFSPIISVVNSSVFPSMLIAAVFFLVFHPRPEAFYGK